MTREQWKREQTKCWMCGYNPNTWNPGADWNWLEVHEIARGPARQAALKEPAAWVSTCARCHRGVLDSMPAVMQLAYKKLNDPENYDRVKVIKLKWWDDEAVSEAEVDAAIETIRKANQ